MQINASKNEKTLTLAIVGRLDTTTAPELEAYIRGNVDGIEHLVLDGKQLEYISSAGLRVLLMAQKTMAAQGDLVLCHLCDAVTEVLEITGFSDILTIEK